MGKYVAIALVIIVILLEFFTQRNKKQSLIKQIYELTENKQETKLLEILDSKACKSYFDTLSIIKIKLNYYLEYQEFDKFSKVINNAIASELKDENQICELVELASNLFLSRNDFASILAMIEILERKETNNERLKFDIFDLTIVNELYNKKVSVPCPLEQELLEAYERSENKERKSISAFRIARLYENSNNINESINYLENARNFTSIAKLKDVYEEMIKSYKA